MQSLDHLALPDIVTQVCQTWLHLLSHLDNTNTFLEICATNLNFFYFQITADLSNTHLKTNRFASVFNLCTCGKYSFNHALHIILEYTFCFAAFILISSSGFYLAFSSETLAFDLLLCYSSFTSSLSLRSKVKNKKLYLATFASVLGPMSFGFVLGYSSPAIPELTSIDDPRLRLNSDQASWFGV